MIKSAKLIVLIVFSFKKITMYIDKSKFTVLLSLLFFTFSTMFASTRPKAPLYWSAYEYSYVASSNQMGGGAIPENIWKANIDWVSENLLPYGYNIICIDGWGDDASINENGYRIKHASGVGESGDINWEHDYAYWSQYVQGKGMTLGIYNNPLWVNVRAADLPIKGREDLKVGSLINYDENSTWFRWVQVDRPGAEEYVKNYIRYYADMGVTYLRVDFLSWYEDGIDKQPSLSTNINRPKEHYQTALRWMKEACDESGMILSLVMPHLYNDAESEILSAPNSLIRINEDICDGGWYRLSEIERGISHSIWSKYHNMFDGFVYWSKVSDKMILDGDFTRLNTFDTDAEKKTAISLQLMAGGPIAVADQYNTIGDNISFYQNKELLKLNNEGFIGRPLSNNPLEPESQIWKGQLSNGDWIIGLFNRENTIENRSLDFATELGIAEGDIHDLWDNTKWTSSFVSENIEPHGCKIYRIVQSEPSNVIEINRNKINIRKVTDIQYEVENAKRGNIKVFSSLGEVIIDNEISDDFSIVDISDLEKGFYIISFSNQYYIINKKVIKNR